MTRIKVLGLALFAVFAMAAIASATASAAGPEFYECAKGTKGVGYEKGCTKEGGKGGYELKVGVGKGKVTKGKAVGTSKLHTNIPGKGDIPVECGSAKSESTDVAPDLVTKAITTFSKCKAAGAPCQSGTKKETIVTAPLSGHLGYISKSPLKVGVILTDEAKPGSGYLAEFDCTGVAHIRTLGAVIGEDTGNINTFSKTSELKFTVVNAEFGYGPSPINNPQAFEGESGTNILTTELEAEGKTEFEPLGGLPSGQEGAVANKGEDIEIKA
jgi:hypothetical protein